MALPLDDPYPPFGAAGVLSGIASSSVQNWPVCALGFGLLGKCHRLAAPCAVSTAVRPEFPVAASLERMRAVPAYRIGHLRSEITTLD